MALHGGETPASLGYRWPAEWEPHAATWLAWPHNLETWPGQLEEAEAAFVEIVRALHLHEVVRIAVGDAALEARARRTLTSAGVDAADGQGVFFHGIATDDAWVRDHGPTFVVRDRDGVRETAALDLGFDAWGGKYPPWDRDAAVPAAIAAELGLRCFRSESVLEGGSIEGNGRGTILTTEQCLLHENRGARSRAAVEQQLAEELGARQVVWLEGGIAGDDTDGHVDDVARFVSPDTVVTALPDDDAHPDAAALRSAERRLRAARDADGKPLAVATLPVPPLQPGPDGPLPASYANFYLANEVCLVPTFAAPADARALETLAELLPGRRIVGIDSRVLVVGLGAIHCLTQQQPA
ncbi:MAG: agmatine deiminase family protein [Deltaproteobacteria bacterium]|nr:agmatine deiminase family protein [Deltaproteobacteria bacterium]